MEWKDEYRHGVLWQDTQHRQFIDKANELLAKVLSGKCDDVTFSKTAYFLFEYCNGHFKIEEEYMRKHGYPNMEAHVSQHKEFIAKINVIVKNPSRATLDKSSDILHNLLEWFTEHILTTDKYLANFLVKHEID